MTEESGNVTKVYTQPFDSYRGGSNDLLTAAMMNNNNMMNNPWAYLIFLGLLGGGFGGFGGRGGNVNTALDMETQNKLNSLQSQLSNNQNAEWIRSALEGNRFAVSQLAQNLNVDYNALQGSINNVISAINTVGANNNMGFAAVQQAVSNGNLNIIQQMKDCCCEVRQQVLTQGFENRIQTIEQTNLLGSQADRNTRSIADNIADLKASMIKEFCDVKEREMQSQINSLQLQNNDLKSALRDNSQTAQFAAMLTPIQAELAAIKAAQPPTITLPNNQFQAVPTLYAQAGADFIASYWANRLSQATNGSTSGTTGAAA